MAIVTTSSGPFGGPGGEQWDEEMHNAVRQINIRAAGVVDSIQVIYDIGGTFQSGKMHGGEGGQLNTVEFRYPDEHLISISGHYGYYNENVNRVVVRSLALETNLGKYGPFGTQEGTPFSSQPLNNGKIIGFFGRSGEVLDAIGVHSQSGGPSQQQFESSLSSEDKI